MHKPPPTMPPPTEGRRRKFIGFRAWVHRPDGTIVTAKELGVRGIPIWVSVDK